MRNLSHFGWFAAIAVVVSLGMAQLVTAADTDAPPVVDVKLQQDQILLGQVVTPENAAVADQVVTLHGLQRELASGKTDENGYFAFAGLHNGVYQVTTAEGQGTFRVWTAETAPPAAQPGALVVTGDDAVRAQGAMRGIRNALANPLVAGGLITAGIVIPIAIDDANDSSTP